MIPLSDDNPTVTTPVMTYALIAITAAVWLLVQGAGGTERLLTSVCEYGFVPAELTRLKPVGYVVPMGPDVGCAVDANGINWLTPLFTIFLHGSWAHIVGNLWFFWVFGNNIEDSMGPWRFLTFYILCGLLAAAAHLISAPSSAIPTVGASGAISGVMGAYLLLFPRARVNLLFILIFFIRVVPVPAWGALLWWFGIQAITALPAFQGSTDTGGVAVWAHIGGFVAGLLLVRLFVDPEMLARHRRMHGSSRPELAD